MFLFMVIKMDLSAKMSKFVISVLMRKVIYAGITITLMISGICLCFYYQLGLQAGLGNLIAYLCLLGIIIVTILARLPMKRDNYNYTLLAAYGAYQDLNKYHSIKAAVADIEGFTNKKLDGFGAYKAAYAENKRLLRYMLTDCAAFDKYVNSKGLKIKLANFALRHDLIGFCDFAILDLIMTGGPNNHKYRFVASTRWFPVYERYAHGCMKWFLLAVLPWVIWFFGTNILTSSLYSSLDISQAALNLARWGIFCLLLQVLHPFGNSKMVTKMASDIVPVQGGNSVVKPAEIEYCTAFAEISQDYFREAVEAGALSQNSLQQDAPAQEQAQSEEEQDPFTDDLSAFSDE